MAVIDRDAGRPLWAQVEDDLRRRLGAGEFGERFPTDQELVEHYGVSRHTVREAVRHLNRAGILRRERGRGSVVERTSFEQPLGALYSLFASIEATGAEQRSTVLAQCETLDAVAAAELGLEPDTPLFHLERVRLADGEPLAIDRAWLPLELGRPLLHADFERTALYDELERLVGVRPTSGWERLAPILPSPAQRAVLDMRRGEAAFHVERLGRVDGRPIEWRTTVLRGAHYRFRAEFEQGAATTLTASVSDPPSPG